MFGHNISVLNASSSSSTDHAEAQRKAKQEALKIAILTIAQKKQEIAVQQARLRAQREAIEKEEAGLQETVYQLDREQQCKQIELSNLRFETNDKLNRLAIIIGNKIKNAPSKCVQDLDAGEVIVTFKLDNSKLDNFKKFIAALSEDKATTSRPNLQDGGVIVTVSFPSQYLDNVFQNAVLLDPKKYNFQYVAVERLEGIYDNVPMMKV